ncbi:TetR/AcrR family transcriptional regulator [Anaerolentibacter hominis]|uniref:TetR/AcrR family transcriptional regulator n=1 Tax=Anaerolentibacter hominis TaxID=3079009 RepID=UPI0031B7F60B
MSKVEDKKKRKKDALFNTAFELFTTKGINKTAISDIVERAGVAKGTFYLYFKDKYDIRNKLIVHKANELFSLAEGALNQTQISGFEDSMLFIIDYILDRLTEDPSLLRFIAKNLGWGVFNKALNLPRENNAPNFYELYLEMIRRDKADYEDPDKMLFTIIELTSSTCFTTILEEDPFSIEEFRPHLHRSIRAIMREYQKEETA